MKVASFFAGCGGLDLGFRQAGYEVVWANEFDKTIQPTYILNHPDTFLCTSDIRQVNPDDIPDCDGFIGGPPCQSWSVGGKQLGLNDERGKLFLDYIRLIKEKHPKFFVIENVQGIISEKHFPTFISFLSSLQAAGYTVHYELLNAADFRIPQDRMRVFIVGFLSCLNIQYSFPVPENKTITLRQAIGDITDQPREYKNQKVDPQYGKWLNHDVYTGPFDSKFMARDRVRDWNQTSFTIQALAKNCPIHPQAPHMQYVSTDKRRFVPGKEHLYRRLSVRECARIQTFPDSFRFIYDNVRDGYKMVGNAVPPRLARRIAETVSQAMKQAQTEQAEQTVLVGYYRDSLQLKMTTKNNLYYLRTGFRRGAFQYPLGKNAPDLLLLHNGKEKHIFRLQPSQPQLMTADTLRQMGFNPHGQNYITFKIEPTPTAIDISKVKLNVKNRNSAMPYLTTIRQLLTD